MKSAPWLCCPILLAPLLGGPAARAQQAGGAGDYTLFDPVPESQLRALAPDRPGKSVTSLTIDAGHIEVESDLWNASYDAWSIGRTTTRGWVTADPNVRIGLNQWAEFDLSTALYASQEQRGQAGQGVQRASGLGDTQIGGKVNFWGNQGGDTALGLIVLAKLPTAAAGLGNGYPEYSAGLPYTLSLPAQVSLTVEPAFGVLRQASNEGYSGAPQLIASFSRPVIGDAVTATLEVFVERSLDRRSGSQDTLDPAVQWQIGKNLQLDAGAYIGLTKAAPDIAGYTGIAVRY
jgi:hypothetical protein